MDDTIYECIITGAGASGLFCAASMDAPEDRSSGRRLILEKTGRAGTKLLMSGGGHCNITHTGDMKDFITCYGDAGRKIRRCLYRYSNLSLMDFLKSSGTEVTVHADGRVFPASMRAEDIRQLLIRRARENGFEFRYDSPVTGIRMDQDGIIAVSGDKEYHARSVVIATGGCSFPASGSDGSFFDALSHDLGLTVSPLRPSLGAVELMQYPYGELSGISFDNARVTVRDSSAGGRTKASRSGALLFTHHDISGPAVLDISKYACAGDIMSISYVHHLDRERTLAALKEAVDASSSDLANTVAAEFGLPRRFCRILVERSGGSLRTLAAMLTDDSFEITGVAGFESAMVTSGGIDLSQVDTGTMELKEYPGIYAIGEALDVDGISGGYNLQFAYSSARTAADAVTDSNKKQH